jgi:methylenetetrahydrofolate reductase (NADPH)
MITMITQLFFDNRDYFDYVKRAKKARVNVRIVPGILPITDYRKLVSFCAGCGARIPQTVHRIFEPLQDDDEATCRAGVEYVTSQCTDLLKGSAPGLHFFTLNRIEPAREILGIARQQYSLD